MPSGKLSLLQERVLVALAGLEPKWTLTGGGALAGFYTHHRETRDVDLFFRGRHVLGDLIADARGRLESVGLDVAVLRTSPMFAQLQARDGGDALVIDLVADPTPIAEEPVVKPLAATTILVDTPHQLLVNKLCALLGRSELRDLVDVRELLAVGGDLERAIADCPRQDAGFSPLTFGWAIRGLPVEKLAASSGWPPEEVAALAAFRDELVERIVASAHP